MFIPFDTDARSLTAASSPVPFPVRGSTERHCARMQSATNISPESSSCMDANQSCSAKPLPAILAESRKRQTSVAILNLRDAPSISPELSKILALWQLVPSVGSPVGGLPLIPCKSPLEGPMLAHAQFRTLVSKGFSRQDLLQLCKDRGTEIGMVVHLQGTHHFYSGFDASNGVEYLRVLVPDGQVPSADLWRPVMRAVDSFRVRASATGSSRSNVAMHCTDGINLTGYFAVIYLLLRCTDRLSFEEAVKQFELARSCRMEDEQFLSELQSLAQKYEDI